MTRASTGTLRSRAAALAAQAADDLLDWLRRQPSGGGVQPRASQPAAAVSRSVATVDAATEAPRADAVTGAVALAPASRRSTAPDCGPGDGAAPLRLVHTDWLYHRLRVTGPATDLAGLRTAAAGAGTIPWQRDGDRMEEDLFHLLVAPPTPAAALRPPQRTLSVTGARILAGQLRAAAAQRQALAVARVGSSRACPFDLHALVPVPAAVLACGPDDPAALAWLWQHWGTTHPLRHVAADLDAAAARGRLPPGEAAWAVTFWSADWTPWRALAQIQARWPALRFDTSPRYDAS